MSNAGTVINPGALNAMNLAMMSDSSILALMYGGISNMYKAPHAPRGTSPRNKHPRHDRKHYKMKYTFGAINGGHQHIKRLFQ